MYVCIHACVYELHTCMCVYIHVCVYMYVSTSYIQVCVYTCKCVRATYMYVCIHACVYELHTCMCVYMYVCMSYMGQSTSKLTKVGRIALDFVATFHIFLS